MGEYPIDPANQSVQSNPGGAAEPKPSTTSPGAIPGSTRATASQGAAQESTYYGAANSMPPAASSAGPQAYPAGPAFANPMPPWPYAVPNGAATPSNQPYPQGSGEVGATQATGYPDGNPASTGYNGYGYPPYHPTPPLHYPPYAYYPPYPSSPYAAQPMPSVSQAAHQPPPPGGGDTYASGHHGEQRTDINQLLNGVANGDGNSLAELRQMLNFDDRELWKGALIGAAAVLLLTNDTVQRRLFRAGNRAQQTLRSGLTTRKKAPTQGRERVEIPIEDDGQGHD